MTNNVSNKIKECFEISKKIIGMYTNLYFILKNDTNKEPVLLNTLTKNIYLNLINEEELYNKLSNHEAKQALELINTIIPEDSLLKQRIIRNLDHIINLNIKKYITSAKLSLSYIPDNINFNLQSSYISLIDIETLKLIKQKIDYFEYQNTIPIEEIDFLNTNYEKLLFNLINKNKLTEFILIYNNLNIEKTDEINATSIFQEYDSLHLFTSASLYDASLVVTLDLAETTIKKIYEIEKNKDELYVFNKLIYITRIEVIISYLDIPNLKRLIIFCEQLSKKENSDIDYINEIIKRKIK